MTSQIRMLAQQLLNAGLNPLPERDRRMIVRVARHIRARNANRVFDEQSTIGERLADKVAAVGGSWVFIAGFGVFLLAWAALNAFVLAASAFDPYPFVFLNLLLSMLAAIQAPIIMMSQNRQAAKDRVAAALDYEVNVKADAAITELHDKMDRVLRELAAIAAGGVGTEPVDPGALFDVETVPGTRASAQAALLG